MSTNDSTYLAVFLGNPSGMAAWNALPEAERMARQSKGMAAWKAWAGKHERDIVTMGGPLGKTKRASRDGVADVRNEMAAFTVVRAPSHDAAVTMFEGHPHFTIFPGEAIDVMPILPVPGM